MMLHKNGLKRLVAGLLTACICSLVAGFAIADPVAQDDPPPLPSPAEGEDAPPPAEDPPPPPPIPAPAPTQTIIYALPPGATLPGQPVPPEEDPLVNLRKKPKKLRIVEGEDPPEGYVEVEKRRRGLVIAGAAVFGGIYIFCVALSPTSDNAWPLAIPVAGPMIAGYRYKDGSSDDGYPGSSHDSNDESMFRVWGTMGTVAQLAGIVLFSVGVAAKKTLWLRQDIAGLSIQIIPTVVVEKQPGLGLIGTF